MSVIEFINSICESEPNKRVVLSINGSNEYTLPTKAYYMRHKLSELPIIANSTVVDSTAKNMCGYDVLAIIYSRG